MIPEMFGVPAGAASALHVPARGMVSVARSITPVTCLRATGLRAAKIRNDPGANERGVDIIGEEQLAREPPERVERGLRSRVTLLGAVAQLITHSPACRTW